MYQSIVRSSSSRKRTRVTATSELASGQLAQEPLRLARVERLAERPALEHHRRVHAEHPLALHGARLAARVLEHELARLALAQLLDLGHLDAELHAELLEDRPSPG
jgi:hypothetical protein